MQITWHPVSRDVGNVKNKSEDLHTKVDIGKDGNAINKDEEKSKNLMSKWLARAKSPDQGQKS
jgi:hypothetical protein